MKILIVDDEPIARYAMAKALRGAGREVLEAENGTQAVSCIRQHLPTLVFLDLNMPIMDGLSVLKELQQSTLAMKPEIIVVTAQDTIEQAIESIRHGAADFISKPYEVERLRAIVRRSEERFQLQQSVSHLQTQLDSTLGLGQLCGVSQPMQQLFDQIRRAAKSHLPVLIRGESGTGKELVAKELHRLSDRASQPWVAINTAAISEGLIESELFGHVKGAFTGADRDRTGVFQQADGGTLFLDEIGDMPMTVQTRLLRVLQEGLVQPVGSSQAIAVDVRVLSATHQDLESSIEQKLFRQDLLFRLRGIELLVPPLRLRHEDILYLAKKFLDPEKGLSNEAIQSLLEYAWPGNVRELKQRLEAANVMSQSASLSSADLGLVVPSRSKKSNPFEAYMDWPLTEAKNRLLADFEELMIQAALEKEGGNISAAARRLGIHRQNLQQKIKNLESGPG
jgi:DNA-binding NtrC family response regulator